MEMMHKSAGQPKDTYKIKITYQNADFSAFFIENLVRGLKLTHIVSVKKTNSGAEELGSSVTNVKLTLESGSQLFGEMTIGDYLISEANKATGSKMQRLTQDLVFDHWAFFLNNHLREAAHEY